LACATPSNSTLIGAGCHVDATALEKERQDNEDK